MNTLNSSTHYGDTCSDTFDDTFEDTLNTLAAVEKRLRAFANYNAGQVAYIDALVVAVVEMLSASDIERTLEATHVDEAMWQFFEKLSNRERAIRWGQDHRLRTEFLPNDALTVIRLATGDKLWSVDKYRNTYASKTLEELAEGCYSMHRQLEFESYLKQNFDKDSWHEYVTSTPQERQQHREKALTSDFYESAFISTSQSKEYADLSVAEKQKYRDMAIEHLQLEST